MMPVVFDEDAPNQGIAAIFEALMGRDILIQGWERCPGAGAWVRVKQAMEGMA